MYDMRQSRIEIDYYSIVYFECITKFDTLYRWASAKGGAYTCFIDASDINVFTRRIWVPPLAEAQRYRASNLVIRLKYTME